MLFATSRRVFTMPLQPERIQYPAMREMDMGPKPQGADMNFWSIQADRCA